MRPLFRKLCLTVCITAATFIARAQPASPVEISKDLLAITDTLNKMTQGWQMILGMAYNSGKYAALKPVREKVQAYIDTKLKYMAAMKDINNSKPLRLAYIDYLNFQKRLVAEGFTLFESLPDGATTQEAQLKMDKLAEVFGTQEASFITKVNEAHQRYAIENNIPLVE